MDQQQIISDLEARAKRVGVPMSEVCVSAGIHPTTFSRWKKSERNPDPKGATIHSVAKLGAVIAAHEAAAAQGVAA